MKPKTNRAGVIDKASSYDSCQTPPFALTPLLPFIQPGWTIWEPAAGEGLLVDALVASGMPEKRVIGTDILTGRNFFDFEPPHWDCLITNPPYSTKYDWFERCCELGKPFALLVPLEMIGAQRAQSLLERHRLSLSVMLLDCRVDFRMPDKGWGGKGAQFPVIWLSRGMLPDPIVFGKLKALNQAFKKAMRLSVSESEDLQLCA